MPPELSGSAATEWEDAFGTLEVTASSFVIRYRTLDGVGWEVEYRRSGDTVDD